MLRRLLVRVENGLLDSPHTVLAVAVVVSVVAVWLGLGIDLRTSRRGLAPEGDANQERWDTLRREFAGPEPLIVAIESVAPDADVQALEAAAEAIGQELRDHELVSRVFYRVDLDWLATHALHLIPPADLTAALDQIEDLLGTDGAIDLSGWAALNDRLAQRIEASLATDSRLPGAEGVAAAKRLEALLVQQRRFLEDPAGFAAEVSASRLATLLPTDRGSITANGFLATHDERMVFVLAGLDGDDADLGRQRQLVAAAREIAARNTAAHPGLRYGLTGAPAMDVEENDTIRRDGQQTSIVAAIGVFVLSLFAFRRRRHALVGLLTLVAGVVWAVGAVRLELGSLNMITIALIPILVGMGIDYAVHPISQYELERQHLSRRDAVSAALRKTRGAVIVSALTTAAVFFCFLLMEFRGFAELGLVTGTGVILCLIAALVVLPALLMIGGVWRDAEVPIRRAAVDHVWDEDAARWITRRPRTVVAVALLATLTAAASGAGVSLRSNLLELLPASAESLRYLATVNDESALSSDFNIVTGQSLGEIAQLRDRAATEDTIERFESILTFLPVDPDGAAGSLARAARLLARVSVRAPEPADPAPLIASVDRLHGALADAADAAFVAGRGDLAGALERARGVVESLRPIAATSGTEATAARAAGEALVRERLGEVIDDLRASAATRPPTLETLPEEIAQRFVTTSGRFLGYLYPAGDMYDPEFLVRFNAASLRVGDDAIGFPVLFGDHSRQITSGFGQALAAGAFLVLALLWVEFRDPWNTGLAMVPVVLGTIWMLGLMRLTGLAFNLANLVAVPIVLGVGIDAGVHMVHRCRMEGRDGIVTVITHTGRAILIASLTTMVGFGSLMFAEHRGMASLGALLLLGLATCTIAALVVLPNLLVVVGRTQR